MTQRELSSKEKGDLFEAEVFDFIRGYVNSGETFLNPKKCKFFAQKGYYSHTRKSEIIVDIAIEAHIQSADKVSQLVIIECKNYKKNVPVDDIEEFAFKLGGIAGQKGKGLVFSRNGFSTGAIETAKTLGIALARLLPNEQVDWVLERTPNYVAQKQLANHKKNEILGALNQENYRGQSEAFFALYDETITTSFSEVFNSLVSVNLNETKQKLSSKKIREFVPYLGQEDIENRVKKLFGHFNSNEVINDYEVDLLFLCDYLSKKSGVNFQYTKELGKSSTGKEILGKFEMGSKEISITSGLEKNTPRWRFTLAHELGHLLLHRKLNIPALLEGHTDTEDMLNWNIGKTRSSNIMRLEWQANSYASCLLLPKELVFKYISKKLDELDIRNSTSGIIYVDEQQCNLDAYHAILTDMSAKFNVSYQSVNYRLAQLRILNNKTNQKNIHALLCRLPVMEKMKKRVGI